METQSGKIRIPAADWGSFKDAMVSVYEETMGREPIICENFIELRFNGTVISLNLNRKEVVWFVQWCSDIDHAYEHPVSKVFFDKLREIIYVRGKGGTIFGSNEDVKRYIVEEFKPVEYGENNFGTKGGQF